MQRLVSQGMVKSDVSSQLLPHLLPPEGQALQNLPWEALHCLHPSPDLHHPAASPATSQHPSSSLGRGVRVTKLTPWACTGQLGWEHRAGCSLLSDSPSCWVVKLLSQWFPMKSLHQEVPCLGSLGKNLPLQEIAS